MGLIGKSHTLDSGIWHKLSQTLRNVNTSFFNFSGRIISYWKVYKPFPDLKRPSTVNMENRMTSQ